MNDIDFANYANGNSVDNSCGNADAVAKTLRMSAENLF